MAKEDNIGALWIKERGRMSGYVEIDGKRTNIVCFTNGYKKEDKHPDYNILISRPKARDDEAKQNNPHEEMQEDAPPEDSIDW